MRNILLKELTLSASPLPYLFILFGLMFFVPGYPVLCGAFFVCLGIFQGFQAAREANDIIYSALLPIAKRDVVRGKYAFVLLIAAAALVLMAVVMVLRMTVFAQAPVYLNNALMNANGFAFGMACVLFGLFNWIFVGGFFKTAYKFARPFVVYIVVAFTVILIAESLHHVPGLVVLNAFGTDHLAMQMLLLCAGLCCGILMTVLACRKACLRFERIDL